jgi:hypothetical protein
MMMTRRDLFPGFAYPTQIKNSGWGLRSTFLFNFRERIDGREAVRRQEIDL